MSNVKWSAKISAAFKWIWEWANLKSMFEKKGERKNRNFSCVYLDLTDKYYLYTVIVCKRFISYKWQSKKGKCFVMTWQFNECIYHLISSAFDAAWHIVQLMWIAKKYMTNSSLRCNLQCISIHYVWGKNRSYSEYKRVFDPKSYSTFERRQRNTRFFFLHIILSFIKFSLVGTYANVIFIY